MADNTEAHSLSDLANLIPENSSGEITCPPFGICMCIYIPSIKKLNPIVINNIIYKYF